jgi:hypothetical protein
MPNTVIDSVWRSAPIPKLNDLGGILIKVCCNSLVSGVDSGVDNCDLDGSVVDTAPYFQEGVDFACK